MARPTEKWTVYFDCPLCHEEEFAFVDLDGIDAKRSDGDTTLHLRVSVRPMMHMCTPNDWEIDV